MWGASAVRFLKIERSQSDARLPALEWEWRLTCSGLTCAHPWALGWWKDQRSQHQTTAQLPSPHHRWKDQRSQHQTTAQLPSPHHPWILHSGAAVEIWDTIRSITIQLCDFWTTRIDGREYYAAHVRSLTPSALEAICGVCPFCLCQIPKACKNKTRDLTVPYVPLQTLYAKFPAPAKPEPAPRLQEKPIESQAPARSLVLVSRCKENRMSMNVSCVDQQISRDCFAKGCVCLW